VLGYELVGAIEFGADPAWEPVLPARYLDAVVTGTWAATSAVVELPATSARMLEQNLLTALLLGLPHTYSSLLSAAPADVSTLRARGTPEPGWHYAEAMGVSDLARAIGLSVRQLQALFAREQHASPIEMLRDIRLERTHQLLTEGIGQQLSVTEVAVRCGFSHLGRFSGSFRDRFGELPSEMLRSQRGALTGGASAGRLAEASGRTGQPSAGVLR